MANSSPVHVVLFRIGDVDCALPAGIVREVLPRLPATRIPGASAAVTGLVNVRGALVTVVDGHVLLGQSRRPEDEGAIVVLDAGERRCGLAVAEVLDFLELPAGTVASQAEVAGLDPTVADGVAVQGDRHFILLNVGALLGPLADPD